MLKISRKSATYKCPIHPRLNYEKISRRSDLPVCTACQAIADVYVAAIELERRERNAARYINTLRGGSSK